MWKFGGLSLHSVWKELTDSERSEQDFKTACRAKRLQRITLRILRIFIRKYLYHSFLAEISLISYRLHNIIHKIHVTAKGQLYLNHDNRC